jgi:hypothetical protein
VRSDEVVSKVESYDLVYTPPMRGLISKHVTCTSGGAGFIKTRKRTI